MGITRTSGEGSYLIRLDGKIDIESAEELKACLLVALRDNRSVHISLEELSELDVTAMQLLLAAARYAQARTIGFEFTGEIPEAVEEAFSQAGLQILSESREAGENA
ncbi:MAG TPA: STAS domain-containing protein [Terracidiphilus sp.]|nr:STAS domain-containing protein [Terracidiphilus sp.]